MKSEKRHTDAIISALSSDGAFQRHADEEQHLQSSIYEGCSRNTRKSPVTLFVIDAFR